MGNWYTNVAVKGAQQSQIVALLEELGRRAYITPDASGWIVVYDEQTDEFDLGALESLALTLSTRLSCIALASCNADDDVLWLGLYEDGILASRYTSSRSAFEDGDEFPDSRSAAEAFSRVLQKETAARRLLRVLSKTHGFLGLLNFVFRFRIAYIFEIQRHSDLSELLDLPRAAVGLGYKYVHRGETPEGMDRAALLRTMVG
jgi:hypothetical protein